MARWHWAAAVAVLLGAAGASASAEDVFHPSELAKALVDAKVKLNEAIGAAAAQGLPIAARYEIDDSDRLHITVRTAAGPNSEPVYVDVLVDPETADVLGIAAVTDPREREKSSAMRLALAEARISLADSAKRAAEENPGLIVVAVEAVRADQSPVAEVQLMKGKQVSKTTVPLN
ncbi:MAG: hypothetical protein U1E56_09110 [Bauldia sp.]